MMTPKSMVYMVVAVFVGYILVSAVPGQMAMYTTPTLSGEQGDTVTLTGKGFSPDNESLSVEQGDSVELYWDRVTTNGTHGIWVNNESISLDILGANGTPAGSFAIVEGRGFSPGNESISGNIEDLSEEIVELSESISEISDDISSVAEVAADAVAAAEAAADAVTSVASTAGEASEAAVDAADAASALRSARSGLELMGTMVWLTVNVFIALGVYWFAKRRFA